MITVMARDQVQKIRVEMIMKALHITKLINTY